MWKHDVIHKTWIATVGRGGPSHSHGLHCVIFMHVVFEICKRQTHRSRQTYRHTDCNTLPTCWKWSIYYSSLLLLSLCSLIFANWYGFTEWPIHLCTIKTNLSGLTCRVHDCGTTDSLVVTCGLPVPRTQQVNQWHHVLCKLTLVRIGCCSLHWLVLLIIILYKTFCLLGRSC